MDTLHDPLLKMAADMVDDLEQVRIANENRLRQLTRSEADVDGEERGFGLTDSHPSVKATRAIVDAVAATEHQAVLQLQRLMRAHPLGPWVKAQPGVGEKQGARLLAALGDPYMRPDMIKADGSFDPARPRTVSELWAYAGLHVIFPVDQRQADAQGRPVGGDPNGRDPGQRRRDAQTGVAGVAASRRRGQRSNWSDDARKRIWLIGSQCVKMPDGTRWRDEYTAARAKYADATHRTHCVRCGPSGKPAAAGTPLSAGHQHARAVRSVAKAILRELWREAGRLHGHDTSPPPPTQRRPAPNQAASAAGTLDSSHPADPRPHDTHQRIVGGV